jgi:hypothetical protein
MVGKNARMFDILPGSGEKMKIFKALFSIFIVTILTLLAVTFLASAATVRITHHYDNPRLETLAGGFSRVLFPATMQAGKPGEPSYPFQGIQALLPPGESVSRIRILRDDWRILGGSHRLYPAQAPVPGIEIGGMKPRFLYDAAAYQVDTWVYPPDAQFTTHYLRGHAIASGAVSPVGYRPSSGEVGYYGTIDVVIETSSNREAREALDLLRTDPETRDRVSKLVANPSALAQYESVPAPLRDPTDSFEYLIITTQDYADDFFPLGDFYTRRGMRTSIMTVEDIMTGYGGLDAADKIRNAIKDKYINNSITHVLLAGDWDGGPSDPKIVPYRGLYCQAHSSQIITDTNIPADLYFAALDGNWNADGDALWGEPGEDDPYSELGVGRAPVDAPGEIAAFINKTIMYQESPVATEVRNALLLGEKLWDNPLTYGDDELEQLIGTCSNHGFTTTGIPPDFTIVKKYDRVATWNGNDVIAEVNGGTNWLAHAGHSNQAYVMRMGRNSISDDVFTNDGIASSFPIMNSTGCYAASFDNRGVGGLYEWADCIAEQMITINHCAVAFIGNSRYGWFDEGSTNGPSNHLQREFYDAIFTEGLTTLGAANERSKDETVPFLDLPGEWEPGAVRWCFYTLNLLGDPALDGWTDTPESLAAVHPSHVSRSDTLFEIETGVSGSMASLYRNGVCYGRGTANASGHIDLVRYRAIPDSVAWLELDVNAHNHYLHRDTLTVTTPTSSNDLVQAGRLEQNVPNPFNPMTVIRFSLARDSEIDLRVYDASGREVARLAHGRALKGTHAITWKPSNLASGVYFYILTSQGMPITRKAVLLR